MSDEPDAVNGTEPRSVNGPIRQVEGEADRDGPYPADPPVDDEVIEVELSSFKALANEKRLTIVHALRQGELCACELEAVLDAPQSTVASHLRKLRDAGIVRTRKDGKWTYYRIADTASLQLLDLAAALGEER